MLKGLRNAKQTLTSVRERDLEQVKIKFQAIRITRQPLWLTLNSREHVCAGPTRTRSDLILLSHQLSVAKKRQIIRTSKRSCHHLPSLIAKIPSSPRPASAWAACWEIRQASNAMKQASTSSSSSIIISASTTPWSTTIDNVSVRERSQSQPRWQTSSRSSKRERIAAPPFVTSRTSTGSKLFSRYSNRCSIIAAQVRLSQPLTETAPPMSVVEPSTSQTIRLVHCTRPRRIIEITIKTKHAQAM